MSGYHITLFQKFTGDFPKACAKVLSGSRTFRLTEEGNAAAIYGYLDRVRCQNNKGVADEYRSPGEVYDVTKELFANHSMNGTPSHEIKK